LKANEDGSDFGAFLDRVRRPRLMPGDALVMEDLAVHKTGPARASVAAAGVMLLYPPPCSPDRNPIENVFAEIGAKVRPPRPGPHRSCSMSSPTPSDRSPPTISATVSEPPASACSDFT